MEYLSNNQLKAFAKRFSHEAIDWDGRVTGARPTLEEVRRGIERFVSLGKDPDLKPSFIETRVELLKICLREKSPLERWAKARDFLVDRLDTQVLNEHITQGVLQDHEVEPRAVLSWLMRPKSILCWCIKAVVMFNVTDDSIKLPGDFSIQIHPTMFPDHRFIRRLITLKAKTEGGEIIETNIPANEETLIEGSEVIENLHLLRRLELGPKSKFGITYSILVDQNSRSHIIKHDDFFNQFTKSHKNIVERYKLDSYMNPSYLLSKLGDPVNIHSGKERQRKFLKHFTGKSINSWKWKAERITGIDGSKLIYEYFSDIEEEIVSITPIYPTLWKPDDYLIDENSLRYEIIDLYLNRFKPYERERLLLHHIDDLSIFNLKTFRELVEEWERNKESGKTIWILQRIQSHYHKHRIDPKEREKWLEYVKISTHIQKGHKKNSAYYLVSPNEKEDTVMHRYIRQKKQAKKLGYDVNDPKHIEEIKKDWDLIEAWDLIF